MTRLRRDCGRDGGCEWDCCGPTSPSIATWSSTSTVIEYTVVMVLVVVVVVVVSAGAPYLASLVVQPAAPAEGDIVRRHRESAGLFHVLLRHNEHARGKGYVRTCSRSC